MDDAEHRIENLEVKLSYLEAHISELNDILREFADRVVELEGDVRKLRTTVEAAELPSSKDPEKPPHY